ncbi:MAG: hypothetical protein ABJB02_03305 [Dokdonella sp.]
MLKELNIIANGLLGLHGYRLHPTQWGDSISNVNFPPPRPIVPHVHPRSRGAATSLRLVPAVDASVARVCGCGA